MENDRNIFNGAHKVVLSEILVAEPPWAICVFIGFYTTIVDTNKFIAVQKAFAFLAIM